MKLSLFRKWKKANYTIGKLKIDSEYFCDTLEPPVRNLVDYNHDGDFNDPGEGKVYGNTAVMPETYEIKMTMFESLGKKMPLLIGTKGFTGVFIHAGETVKNTKACILAGKNDKPGRLVDSPYCVRKICEMLTEAELRNEKSFIIIEE